MSNLGKWDPWYAQLSADAEPAPYGVTEAYKLGADWLASCAVVEDWGCEKGWFSTFRAPVTTIGLDGTNSPFADEIVDLASYISSVPGIFMRGVIEHDYRWRPILANALASFTERMVLVLFTPMSEGDTHEIAFVEEIGVPDISFAYQDIVEFINVQSLSFQHQVIDTPGSGYGVENLFFMERVQ